VHDCVRLADGRVAIVMEYIGGGSLRARLAAAPDGLPLAEALRWAREIAEGLRAAHGAGLVHRDVKPDNVLIDESGAARVSDFGLAFTGDGTQPRYTQTGATAGTPGYMPPELWQGGPADVRSDVFSFGAMLYEMLTGRLPQGSFPPPRTLRPEVAPALSDAVVAALRPDPAQRPPDMAAMLRALSARRSRYSRRGVIALASAGVAAGIAATAPWWRRGEAPADAPPPEPGGGEKWTRIPWPNPPATAQKGGWRLEKGALISDDQICILAIPAIRPEPCRLRLRFRRLSGVLSVGVFLRTPLGTGVCTLDGRGLHLGGVQSVGGKTLEQAGGFTLELVNGRDYELVCEIRRGQIRMWVDGQLREDRNIEGKPLSVPDTWAWWPGPQSAAVHIGSWESPTQFHSLEWMPLE
jgi:Protein kinase domain